MPQVELKYSNNLTLDVKALFNVIETVINEQDAAAGVCKSRAYPASDFLHDHILINIKVLKKPHRDQAFMNTLLQQINQRLSPLLPVNCHYALALDFASEFYLTTVTSN